MTLTFGSLFTGIGGFDLGMERAGLQADFQCENNKDCQGVLRRHWPDVRLYNDVKEINQSNTITPDVILGGFPCQDLSVAGKREGLAGKRSGLWFEFYRILAELKPRFVIIENVPGLLSSSKGRDFAVILRWLAECGYYAAWRILDAQYFGVAQRRRRVFIVASFGEGSCAQILFESEGGAWDSPPSREAGERIAATITERFGGASNQRPPINEADNLIPEIAGTIAACAHPGSYNSRDAERDMLIAWDNGQGDPNGDNSGLAYALNDQANQGVAAFSESGPGWWRDGIGTLRERDYKDGNTGLICNGYTGGADDNDAQGNYLVAYNWQSGGDTRLSFGLPNLQANQVPAVGVRRLTPVECERLQGFPDGFTDGQSDSARYRQLGNAIAVPVAKWIGRRIVALAT